MVRLRRSDLSLAGISRHRRGKGFMYLWPDGSRVTDADVLTRIRALVIPPAWTDVWISPWPNGHIQAIGSDARGRRQYRYHDVWRTRRDAQKFEHMASFAASLGPLRRIVAEHLAEKELNRNRVLACATRLLDVGFFRIGTEGYAEENNTFGLATMRRKHVCIDDQLVTFDYPAKSGKRRVQSVVDVDVAEVVDGLKHRRGGGRELLAYREENCWVDVKSVDINAYLKAHTDTEITAKDFRTWHATVLCAVGFACAAPPASTTAAKRAVASTMRDVARYLGNTAAVCRSSYVDPRVVDRFLAGSTIADALLDLGGADLQVLADDRRAAIEAAVMGLIVEAETDVAEAA
jgi:DNA topoisomerase IB